MKRIAGLVIALVLTVGTAACSSDHRFTATGTTFDITTTTIDEESTAPTVAPSTLDMAAAVSALVDLCPNPVAGDPSGQALGTLVPVAFTTCDDVSIWQYLSAREATSAFALAEGDVCGRFDGADGKFAQTVAGPIVVQVSGVDPRDGTALAIVPSNQQALSAAAEALNGEVHVAAC